MDFFDIYFFILFLFVVFSPFFAWYLNFLIMNNDKPYKWSNFKEFKEKYDNIKWDIDERFNWFFNIKSRDYNFRVDNNGFFSHQDLLHAKIIRFDDQNIKLFPLSLIRAILYVKKTDKQENLKRTPACNSQRVNQ